MGTGLALDPAAHFNLVEIIEGGGGGAGGVVEMQGDLGHIARGPVARAGKNHIIHAGGAQGLVGAFAHHPAQGLDQIRFAAAIGADDTGQTRLDQKFCRFYKGLEADKLQTCQFHRALPLREMPAFNRSQQRIDCLFKFLK